MFSYFNKIESSYLLIYLFLFALNVLEFILIFIKHIVINYNINNLNKNQALKALKKF